MALYQLKYNNIVLGAANSKPTIEELQVKKQIEGLKLLNTAMRPMQDYDLYRNKTGQNRFANVLRTGFLTISMYDLFELNLYSDILQLVFGARARETFREGIEIDPIDENASENQKKKIERFIKKANNNNQTLKEVLTQFNKDLDWADDAYLLVTKDYYINEAKDIIGSEVREILRVNPLAVKKVLDDKDRLGYTPEGKIAYFSVFNREVLVDDEVDPKTGIKNLVAHYEILSHGGQYLYYNASEVLHKSDFNPTITYGFSPLYSLYNKLSILLNQDYYMRQYYSEDKPLKGLLVFNTSNREGLTTMWDELMRKKQRNPHTFYPIPIQSKEGGKMVDFIDMSRTLVEMQFTETRQEIRQQIGATYGVSPIFQNDMSTSGGLNNEGLEITVTNRAIIHRQEIYNTSVLPFIFESNLGITDWNIYLRAPIEEDEAAEVDLEAKRLANAKSKMELGLKGRMDENGEIIFIAGDLELQQPQIGDEFMPFGSDKEIKSDINQQIKGSAAEVIKADENPLPVKEEKKFETNLQKELKKVISKLDLKQKPTEEEMRQIVDKATKNLDKQLKIKSANRVKAIYNKAINKVEKELNTTIKFGEPDKNAIELLKRDPKFLEAFDSLSSDLRKDINKIITEAYNKPEIFTIDKMVDSMKEKLDESNNRLQTIARTETAKISSAARKNSYAKTGDLDEMKFMWIGVDDARTAPVSKAIKARTKGGVSWSNLIKIIKQEVKKYNPKWIVNEQAPITHPNSRHTFIKKVN